MRHVMFDDCLLQAVVDMLRSKESDLSLLEDVSRQINVDNAAAAGSVNPKQLVHQIKAEMATLIDRSVQQTEMIRKLNANRIGLSNVLCLTVDSLLKKEETAPRRQLTLDVESVEGELNRLATLEQQVDDELDGVIGKLSQQESIYSELGQAIPAEVQQRIDELKNAHARIKVRHFTCSIQFDLSSLG